MAGDIKEWMVFLFCSHFLHNFKYKMKYYTIQVKCIFQGEAFFYFNLICQHDSSLSSEVEVFYGPKRECAKVFFGNPTIVGSWQNTLNLSSFITISLILKLRVFSRSWFRVPTRLFFWPWKSFTSKEKYLKRNTWYDKIQSTSSPSDRWIHSDLCMDIDDIPNKPC